MGHQSFNTRASSGIWVDRRGLVQWISAAISLFLLPLAGVTAQAETLQDWRVDSEPMQLDSYRKAMNSNPAWGVAVLKKGDKDWSLARGPYTFNLDLLRDSSIELLAVEYDTRFVRLLLPEFGKRSSHSSRMGYWCKGGLFGHKRKEHGYTMCTTEFSRNVTGGWATLTGVTSLGQTIEYVAAVDPEAIRRVVRSIDLDAQRTSILDNSARNAWAIKGGSPTSGATTGKLIYPPELVKRDEKIRQNLAAQRSAVPSAEMATNGSPSAFGSGPVRIGERICRTGRLDYVACFNPEFQSSCVNQSASGQLQGYVEGFSPDSTRIQIRIAQHAFVGETPSMIAAYPALDGLKGQPNSLHWDHVENWWSCAWR